MKNKLSSTLLILVAYTVIFMVIVVGSKLFTYCKESKKLYSLYNIISTDQVLDKESKWIGDYGAYYTFTKKSKLNIHICNDFNLKKTYSLSFVLSGNEQYKYKECQISYINIHNKKYDISSDNIYTFEIQPSSVDKCISAKLIIDSPKFKCHKWLGFMHVSVKKK